MLNWFLILLLPFSLAWKSAIRIDYSNRAEAKIESFLTRNLFKVEAKKLLSGRRSFLATKGACRMLLTEVSHDGWELDGVYSRAAEAEQAFIVFQGRVYGEQPTWLTATDFLWYKVRSELGFKVAPSPIIAVIATNACGAEHLPWPQLNSDKVSEL